MKQQHEENKASSKREYSRIPLKVKFYPFRRKQPSFGSFSKSLRRWKMPSLNSASKKQLLSTSSLNIIRLETSPAGNSRRQEETGRERTRMSKTKPQNHRIQIRQIRQNWNNAKTFVCVSIKAKPNRSSKNSLKALLFFIHDFISPFDKNFLNPQQQNYKSEIAQNGSRAFYSPPHQS